MKANEVGRTWVVYQITLPGKAVGRTVVCEQSEWERIEAAQPGFHTLLHFGLKTEQEAEKLARGTAGDDYRRGGHKKKQPR
jgi:hypothetical protein